MVRVDGFLLRAFRCRLHVRDPVPSDRRILLWGRAPAASGANPNRHLSDPSQRSAMHSCLSWRILPPTIGTLRSEAPEAAVIIINQCGLGVAEFGRLYTRESGSRNWYLARNVRARLPPPTAVEFISVNTDRSPLTAALVSSLEMGNCYIHA